jgi:hypothetical protein
MAAPNKLSRNDLTFTVAPNTIEALERLSKSGFLQGASVPVPDIQGKPNGVSKA